MSRSVKYGYQRSKKKASKSRAWLILAGLAVWAFAVFTWGAGQIAALYSYHEALGEPALEAFGRLWYWPWKVLIWGQEFSQYGVKGYFIVQDTKQLNQTYGQDNALMANCHIRIAYAPTLIETAEMLSKLVGTTTVVDQKTSISKGGGKSGASRSTNVSETARALLTPDECLRLPGISRDKNGRINSGDMLILTAGNPPIYGRQILYFLDPTFSARAKKKAPGVVDGWSRGLSHSLYHPMPIINSQPPRAEAPAISEQNALDLTAMNDDLADIYSEYLKAAAGGQ